MDPNRSLEIQTERIKVGMTFDFDLTDSAGRAVLRAGQPFDESIRKRLLVSGVETLTILVMPQGQSLTKVLLEGYSAESVEKLDNMINHTEQTLQSFVEGPSSNRTSNCDALRNQLDRFIHEATNDSSMLLGVLAARWNVDLQNESSRIGSRSTRLSCLSMVTGSLMGLSNSDLISVGLAALMHDVSVFFHPEWQNPQYRAMERKDFITAYQRHPNESVEFLSMTAGLGQQTLVMISQLHEQLDGSGFPRGLRGPQILPGSRILNVVDAYLEIVDPLFRVDGVVPSDALAQICFNAVQGVFDREATRNLIDAISVYPIGTEVDLSDSRRAVVVRSNPGKPLEPVVRLLDGSQEVADLLHTRLFVRSPVTGARGRRLKPQIEMGFPLWDACTVLDSEE